MPGQRVAAASAVDLRDRWALNPRAHLVRSAYTESYEEPFRLMNQIANAARLPKAATGLPAWVIA